MHTGNPEKCRTLANSLTKLISNRKTIVYVDFVRHVAPLKIALRECGTEAAGYHGKNLSTHDKKKRRRYLVGGGVMSCRLWSAPKHSAWG